MTHSMTGPAFSIDVINAQPLPAVPKHLLPWLQKDRREAIEGSTFYNSQTREHQHDRMGLDYAKRELSRIERDLHDLKGAQSYNSDRAAILQIQRTQAEAAVQFWTGKIYLLDRMIGQAHAANA